MLEGKGAVLATAREVSALIRDAGLPAAVIGGVAVALHGHVRTTIDVDILVKRPLEAVAELLTAHGFEFDVDRREFIKNGVPVHLVTSEQTGASLGDTVTIDEVTTVTLAALIEMKLRSGAKNVLRAQDLADVIGLIRVHQLTAAFVRHLHKTLRPEFRALVRAIGQEAQGKGSAVHDSGSVIEQH
ncbi:MAG: hypothetical protein ACO1SX_27140 [Actinomycetota bacterium]